MSALTVSKAIAGAVATGLTAGLALASDGDAPLVCILAGLAAACGGFASVYVAPRNANTTRNVP
jgi:hypothetical protein